MGMNVVQTVSSKIHTLGDASGDATFSSAEAGTSYLKPNTKCTFQAVQGTAGTTTSTTEIQVSNDETTWITMGTITLSGSSDTDGFTSDSAWKYVRAEVTALGSGSSVAVYMGV